MSIRTPHRTVVLLALAATLALALPACTSAPPEPAGPTEAQLRQQAEEQRKAEEEARRLAEEARQAEAARQVAELRELFGPVGEPPLEPGSAPPAEPAPFVRHVTGAGTPAPAAAGTIPYDEAVPPLPPEPVLRVAVLSHGVPLERGRQVAVQLGTHARERLEEQLGMAVRVLYVAETTRPLQHPSEIRHRPELLRAAQSVAQELAAEQWLGPLGEQERAQPEVDLVVHIGPDYR